MYWTFLFCRKELSFVLNMAQRIDFFCNVTQRIELFSLIWLTELTFFMTLRIELFQLWLKEMNLVFKYDSIFFLQKMTQKIECFFFNISQRTDFSMTQRIGFFTMHRIEPFLFSNMSQRSEPLFHINCFLLDSKSWTFFLNMTQRVEHFSNLTHRVELFF